MGTIEQEKIQIIEKLLCKQMPFDEIAEICDCDLQEVKAVKEKMLIEI